jgi:hypothetical protein
MSTLASNSARGAPGSIRETTSPGASAKASGSGKRSRQRHTPGGAALGQDVGQEAQRLAAAILDVLAGVRTPAAAAAALGISPPRYFQIEARAVQALVDSCKPRPRGPGCNSDKELAGLRRQLERLQQEVNRQQTLLRVAQRTIGLPPPKKAGDKPVGKEKGKKRSRRPVVRALRAAATLHRRSQESDAAPLPSPASAATTPAGPGPS